MNNKEFVAKKIEEFGIVAIIRTKKPEQVEFVCEALLKGGISALELTMTIPNATEKLKSVVSRFGKDAVIGMGSVLDARMAEEAIAAGAQFIVSPITFEEIAETAKRFSVICMLGAYSPTEAQKAYRAGSDYIKIFPADTLGLGYIKALLAPMPHLKLIPTGGVNLGNVKDFIKAGVPAVGVGSSLITKIALDTSDWESLTKLAANYIDAIKEARAK